MRYCRRTADPMSAIGALLTILFVALACNMRADDDWREILGHKKLSRASTSGSMGSSTTFYFCPNGEYAMQTQSTGFSTGGAGTLSMAGEDVELGRWSVNSGTLYLKAENGETRELDISQGSDSDVIKLNDVGYLVSSHDECR